MKVVFLQDVPNVARAGDIKEVANGYGRNYLIPQKLATLATPAAISSAKIELEIKARLQERTEAELVELANQLDGKEVTIEAQTGAKDRLYGSITSADIADGLQTATGLAIDKRKIELDKPIRQLGSYEVIIRLAKDITPKIMITIAEKETGEGAVMKKKGKSTATKKTGKGAVAEKKGKSTSTKKTGKGAVAEEEANHGE